jgi:hypothetical protein
VVVTLNTDQLRRLEGSGTSQRLASAQERCIDLCRIRPTKLPARWLLKKRAARCAAHAGLAIDVIEQLGWD